MAGMSISRVDKHPIMPQLEVVHTLRACVAQLRALKSASSKGSNSIWLPRDL